MDDESIYGPTVYTWTLGQGIEHGYLADYRVLVPVVTDEDLRDLLNLPAVADLRPQRSTAGSNPGGSAAGARTDWHRPVHVRTPERAADRHPSSTRRFPNRRQPCSPAAKALPDGMSGLGTGRPAC
ncbi:hypothetical protein ACIGXI_26125 [Kitasatospora aureofaciens]|uniref:hypothetical protein n=1 Tax=Kitasatospora aureofaciens TaxID=1894 RepID=UPI0037C80BC6